MKTCLFAALAAALALTGCQDPAPTPRKSGSYFAARHMMTGSNIPQPSSAENVNSTVDQNTMDRMAQQQATMSAARTGGR